MDALKRWVKRTKQSRAPELAAVRARMVSTDELVRWSETTLYAIGRSLSEQRKGDPDRALAFIENAVSEGGVLIALLDELHDRAKGHPQSSGPGSSLYG